MNFKRFAICVVAIFAVTIVASCSDETGASPEVPKSAGELFSDWLATERPLDRNGDGVELPGIGAYEYVPIVDEIVAGRYVDGEFVAWPKMPVFQFKWKYQVIDYLSGKDHTVLRIPAPKRKEVHKVSSAYAYIQFLSPVDAKPLSDRKFKVTFYKVKMDEKEYFVSEKPDGTGLALAFVDNPELEGVYDHYELKSGSAVPVSNGKTLGIALYAIDKASFYYEVPHDQFN